VPKTVIGLPSRLGFCCFENGARRFWQLGNVASNVRRLIQTELSRED
jgi:hypothetical protein